MTPQRVSVVVCAVAPSLHLDQSVASLLAQTGVEIEIVVVWDTAPTPATQAWEHDERVVVTTTGRRAGTPAALNHGVAHCRHEIVARLDHDDLALAERLKKQMDYLESHPDCVLVGSRGVLIGPAGEPLGQHAKQIHGDDVRHELLRRNVVTHSSVALRKEALMSIGGYDARCTRMQDYDMILRIAKHGKVAVLPERLVAYRVHGGQRSRNTSPFKAYAWHVIRSRQRLNSYLGRPRLMQLLHDASWWAAQVLRHSGLRKARYLAGLTAERSS